MTRPRFTPLLLVLVPLAFAPIVGCGEGKASKPSELSLNAPTLDDDSMTRLLATMREIRMLSTARKIAEAKALGGTGDLSEHSTDEGHTDDGAEGGDDAPHVHPVTGVGMTLAIGDDAIKVVQRHGFQSPEEFERTLSFAILALQQLSLGDSGGLDQPSKTYSIRASIQDYQERLEKLQLDDTLVREEKTIRASELKIRIKQMKEQLAEDKATSDAMRDQFQALPPENLEMVKKYQQEFVALLLPH